jgi:hypothetical protein
MVSRRIPWKDALLVMVKLIVMMVKKKNTRRLCTPKVNRYAELGFPEFIRGS